MSSSKAPGLADDLRFDDAKAAGWTVTGPTSTDDGGLQVELTHPFANPEEATALLQSINGSGGPLHNVDARPCRERVRHDRPLAGSLRIDGLAAFADPDVLAAVGATPYAEEIAASGQGPSQAVGVTVGRRCRARSTRRQAQSPTATVSWIVPLDGSQLDLATNAVDDHGTAKIWGIASNAALIALVAWCVIAAAFIAWVVQQRKRRAHHHQSHEPCNTPSLGCVPCRSFVSSIAAARAPRPIPSGPGAARRAKHGTRWSKMSRAASPTSPRSSLQPRAPLLCPSPRSTP